MIKVKFTFIIIYVILFALPLFINEKIFFIIFYGVTIIVIIELFYLILIFNFTLAKFNEKEIILRVKDRQNVRVFIHNKLRLPIFYLKLSYKIDGEEIESLVPDLFYRANVHCNVKMYFEKRGIYTLENFRMYFMDFLNIITLNKLVYKEFKIKVYPNVKQINLNVKYSSHILKDEKNSGTVEDVVRIKNIRKYSFGDPIKKIHWKLSAKHNEFFVKDYDSISGGNQLMVLNMNKDEYGFNKQENDEEMVSLLCSIISLYLSLGQCIDLRIFSKDVDNFLLRSQNDYAMLLEYFLKKTIESGTHIVDRLISDDKCYKEYGEIFLFTPIINKELAINLDDLSRASGRRYTIFHIGKSPMDVIESLKALEIKAYAFNDIIL
ncbi:MAG: DUF58 domain-containing protein [Oscillospiraceae bacterium]|nr:DUF58 domain-containing protein [Oscillospiraceae bacterium]